MRSLILFFITVASLQAWMVDGVAVLVKEEPITLYDIQQEMQQKKVSQKQAVDLLIRQKLEAQEIKTRDLSVQPSEVEERVQQIAQRNNLSISQLYDAVWSTQHLTSDQFKAKLEQTMLRQKLYRAIAMSNVDEPSEADMREYYRLHSEKFSHPDTINVTVYHAPAKGELNRKMNNPMLNLDDVKTQDAALPYARIEPQLAELLLKTKDGSFTPILPDPKGGFVSFYIRSKSMPVMQPFDKVESQVKEEMMADEREAALKDYFDRARLNADIKTLRLPDGSDSNTTDNG